VNCRSVLADIISDTAATSWDPRPRANQHREPTNAFDVFNSGGPHRSVQFSSHSLRSCSGPAGAFSHSFEVRCCRFEIFIRRPEAHFALREAKERKQFASAG
jgi:hypothetical protein